MTERVLGPSGSKRRRTRLLTIVALIGSALTIFFVAASSATLPGGSTFDTGNGTLTDSSENDWNPAGSPTGNDGPVEPIDCVAPGISNCGLDLVDDANDNAYGQGAKNDDPSPSVVTGSIPPNKDDLSRFYVNKQKVGTGLSAKDFLYLAWERSNLLGSAHMDFEFNQKFCDLSATPTNCAANNVNPVRTKGDLLIDFDFGGSGPVGLSLHTWITSDGGNAANCEASNSLPCWDKAVPLTNAEASVNSVDVTDYNAPAPAEGRNLDGDSKQTGQSTTVSSEFGEAGINLTDSGVFPQNQCVNFGSAALKSRSAGSSFSSELKDFIAPIPVNISNCGTVVIQKKTIGGTGTFDFTSSPALPSPANATGGFSLTTTADGETGIDSESFANVLSGTQRVTETPIPSGWTLTDISCSPAGSATIGASGGFNAGDTYADITVAPSTTVTCTFTNTKKGKIVVDKVTNPSGDAQSFSFTPTGTGYTTGFSLTDAATPNDSGALNPGSYTVGETVPSGWDLTGLTCSGGDNTYTGASGGTTSFEAGDTTANIDLDAGETVNCTFTNSKQGKIKIVKDAIPNDDDDFSFVRSFPSAGTAFSLDDDGDNANALSNTFTSGFLSAGGTYTVSETVPSNWDLTNIVCVDDAGGGAALDSTVTISGGVSDGDFDSGDTSVSIVLAAGETVRCTFTNNSEHIVIVAVCHTATNTLAPSDVTDGTTPTTSVAAGALPAGITEAELCGLTGARYTGLPHGSKSYSVDVGSDAHP